MLYSKTSTSFSLMGMVSESILSSLIVRIERSSGPRWTELSQQISQKDPHCTHPDRSHTSTSNTHGQFLIPHFVNGSVWSCDS